MAVFGWTSSPGFFAVFGKAVRHYQRTGHSIVLGNTEPFWSFQWVDDIVLIEVDLGDRLMRAKSVSETESNSCSAQKAGTRASSQPSRASSMPLVLIGIYQRVESRVIGVLRHLISFVPVTKPFIQRLTAVQNRRRMLKKNGVPMTSFLRKDLAWWSVLAFQNELAGIPMDLFDQTAGFDDAWLVTGDEGHISITSMKLLERLAIGQRDQSQREGASAQALAEVTNTWGPSLTKVGAWRHVIIHGERWVTDMIDKMNSKSSEGQDALRLCN
ncbi:unnamed protein product [Phytophthora fragariaefolia]|uniref:Unnamed protein product n=1 Tax=Phytophthora fragariaefolia TaxID=1490495 RepID=A0A9W6YDG7_9STRA|nr:unnamed protein product [Phytophthora fragariaefolia]